MPSVGEQIVYMLELLLNTTAIVPSVLFAVVLHNAQLFTRNQKPLVLNVIFANLLTIFTRFPLLFEILTERELGAEFKRVLVQLHNLSDSVVLNMLNQMVIFVDCLVSTVERKHFPGWMILVSIIAQWALAYLNIYLGSMNIPPPLYTMILLEVMNLITWAAYFGLVLLSRFQYKTQQIGAIGEKFELSVQVRTLDVLKILAVWSALRNFVDINVILLLDTWIRPHNVEGGEKFVSFFYDLSLSVYSLVLPVHMILTHPEMRRKLKERFLHMKPSADDRAFVSRNAVGQDHLHVANTKERHFAELNNHWNAPHQQIDL
ncbi:hypothetical protein M3Y99_01499900 [Aphelenchoides fujianensis]|nr:hypothetical protein M3Y99_01499900 [Aphelenchoides fujianensis]